MIWNLKSTPKMMYPSVTLFGNPSFIIQKPRAKPREIVLGT